MLLRTAKKAANALIELLEPVCEPGRCRAAGSVRRECAECGDVELVIIPKWGERSADGELFPRLHNLAQLAIEGVGETLVPIKPGVPVSSGCCEARVEFNERDALCPGGHYCTKCGEEAAPPPAKWPLKPEGRYWRLWMPKIQASADIFVCSPERWGLNYAIRTGSADFSHGLARRWNQLGGVFAGSRLVDRTGKTLETPEEEDVFRELEIMWREPQYRWGAGAVEPI